MLNRNTIGIVVAAFASGLLFLAGQRLFMPQATIHRQPLNAVQLTVQRRPLPAFHLRQGDQTPLVPGELLGHWTIIAFGCLHCPNSWSPLLITLAQAQRQWHTLSDSIRPRLLLISVDPKRETLMDVNDYAHQFHPDTLTATGDLRSLEQLAQAVGIVIPTPIASEHSSADPREPTSIMTRLALIDPHGHFAGRLDPPFQADAIAADLLYLTHLSRP